MTNRPRLFSSRKALSIFIAVALISLMFGIFKAADTSSSNKKLDAFGICSGYSLKLLDQIPEGALDAVYKYLKDYQPVTILSNISEVNPVLEPSVPHLCPKPLDSLTVPPVQERVYLTEIGSSVFYSGVIPPGATKAFMVGVDHASKISTYAGNNPTIAEGIKNTPYTTSNIIVAFYPDKGWIGVYDDPGAYGGFHY